MRGFRRIAVAAAAATFLLIGIGGFVRAAGAGLGCPDWPRCFGRWIPPTSASQLPAEIDPARFNFALAWTEYVNRLAGVVVGLLILGTAGSAWRHHRRRPRILWPAMGALLLVGFQGWFGGQVVAHELDPRLVTVHLLVALALGALLLHVAVEGFAEDGRVPLLAGDSRLVLWTVVTCGAAVVVQAVLGALVRGSLESALEAEAHVARASALSRVGSVAEVHYSWAVIVLLLSAAVYAAAQTRLRAPRALQRLAQAPVWLAAAQFAAGVGLAALDLPPALQLVHLFVGSLLFGVLTLLGLLLAAAEMAPDR